MDYFAQYFQFRSWISLPAVITQFICLFFCEFQTERAKLQETVNRLQGELVARSDALRQATLETSRLRRDHEKILSDHAFEWQERMHLLDIRCKEEIDKTTRLEGELEQLRDSKHHKFDSFTKVSPLRKSIGSFNHVLSTCICS